jgi:DNA integrity scanning protein DisA with diadenylate cyclase activity
VELQGLKTEGVVRLNEQNQLIVQANTDLLTLKQETATMLKEHNEQFKQLKAQSSQVKQALLTVEKAETLLNQYSKQLEALKKKLNWNEKLF